MALVGKSAELRNLLAGQEVQPPKNFFDIGVKASFIEGDPQPAITTDNFEFILDAYTLLKQRISDGKVFEGTPYQLFVDSTAPNTLGTDVVFDGYVDIGKDLIDDTNGVIEGRVRYKDDLSSLSARIQALDYSYLYAIGVYTDADFTDCDYVVVKIDYTVEAFIQTITLYLMVTQLIELIKQIGEDAATIAGFLATPPFTGSAAYTVAMALVNVAFAIALIVEIIQLGTDLILAFVQPKRTHKCISYRKLIEKVCNYLGYGFSTTIPELDRYHYLPSNKNVDVYDGIRGFLAIPKSIENGLPHVTDYGHLCQEMFDLVRQMFNGRFAVRGSIVEFHSELSPYWFTFSTFELPDILGVPYKYNKDELQSNVFLSFQTDIVEGYTIQNFKGTNYQVITSELIPASDPKSVVINGLQEPSWPVALATRKNELNGFEKFLKVLAGVIDGVVNTITTLFPVSGSSNLVAKIIDKIGIMKVETNNHSVPKVVYLDTQGKLPINHRDLLSAKFLWENYWNEVSFVGNSGRRQRRVYEGVEIPFGWSDFQKLINNSYFVLPDGQRGKVTDIEWIISQDRATISYWIEEVYTTNLKETFIEPE